MPVAQSTRRKKAPTPRKARTQADIARMPFDNIQLGSYGILVSETTVSLDKQAVGSPPEGRVELPRWVFDAFVDWYEWGAIPPGEKRSPE